MIKFIFKIVVMLIVILICGFIGFIIGADLGGNYAPEFEFIGRRGYEAVGLIGTFAGFILGGFVSYFILFKKRKK